MSKKKKPAPPSYKRLKSCGRCYDIVGAVGTTEGRLLGEVRKDDCTDIIHARVTPLLDAAQQAADIEHQKLVRDTLKATLRAHLDADARAVGERERAKNLAAEAARFKAVGEEKVTIRPNPDALSEALRQAARNALYHPRPAEEQPVKVDHGNDFVDTFTIPRMVDTPSGRKRFKVTGERGPEIGRRDPFTTPAAGAGPQPKPGGWTVEELKKPTNAYEPPPSHYATPGGIDPWAVWDAFDLDPWEASLVKYILRAGKKPGEARLKDLKKARNYLGYLIEREEKK